MKSYGITGHLLKWLRNLLSRCTHGTKIGVSLSAIVKLIGGVIQVSGIGALIFLTLILLMS